VIKAPTHGSSSAVPATPDETEVVGTDEPDTALPTTAPSTTVESSNTTTTVAGVYSHTGVGQMSPAVANAKNYVYVPSNGDGSVK
jgi:hypothetical protein